MTPREATAFANKTVRLIDTVHGIDADFVLNGILTTWNDGQPVYSAILTDKKAPHSQIQAKMKDIYAGGAEEQK